MSGRVPVATTWLQSCSGCHIALLDLHEELLDLLGSIDIRYSPIVDVKEVPETDLGIVEGSVGNRDNTEMLLKFRERSKTLIAFGTCACFGGIPGLRNLFTREELLRRGYVETESTVDGIVPAGPELPALEQYVKPLNQLVPVEHYIPGCPPLPSTIKKNLVALLGGGKPEVKKRNLCEECDRTKKKLLVASRDFVTDSVVSPHELDNIDRSLCFLEQGVLCMGPATCEGCAQVFAGNMPCRGCMGLRPRTRAGGEEHQRSVGHPAGGWPDVSGRRRGRRLPLFPAGLHLSASCQ